MVCEIIRTTPSFIHLPDGAYRIRFELPTHTTFLSFSPFIVRFADQPASSTKASSLPILFLFLSSVWTVVALFVLLLANPHFNQHTHKLAKPADKQKA